MPESNDGTVNLWPSIDFRSIRKFQIYWNSFLSTAAFHSWCEINKMRMVRLAKHGEWMDTTGYTVHTRTSYSSSTNRNWINVLRIYEISILAFESNQFTCQRNTHGMWCMLLNATGVHVEICSPCTDRNWRKFVKCWCITIASRHCSCHSSIYLLPFCIHEHISSSASSQSHLHTLELIDRHRDRLTDRPILLETWPICSIPSDNVGNMFVNKLWFRKQHQFINRHFVSSHRQHYWFIYTFQRVVSRCTCNDVANDVDLVNS